MNNGSVYKGKVTKERYTQPHDAVIYSVRRNGISTTLYMTHVIGKVTNAQYCSFGGLREPPLEPPLPHRSLDVRQPLSVILRGKLRCLPSYK